MNKPKNKPRRPQWRPPDRTALVFSPLAWLKLMFFLHAGETEVGGFAISDSRDLLYVLDFVTVKQRTSSVSVDFADDSVADYFDTCVDAGLPPARFARIWCHTHPGHSPDPSGTDEETFDRVFGSCDWSVMFIVSRTGRTYARLAFNAGPKGAMLIPVEVDWAALPRQLAEEGSRLPERMLEWIAEYDRNIQAEVYHGTMSAEEWSDARDAHDPDDPYGLDPFIRRVMDDPANEAVHDIEQVKGALA